MDHILIVRFICQSSWYFVLWCQCKRCRKCIFQICLCRLNVIQIHFNFCYENLPERLVILFKIIIKLMLYPTTNLSAIYYTYVFCVFALHWLLRYSENIVQVIPTMNNINRNAFKTLTPCFNACGIKWNRCYKAKIYILSKP